MKKLIFYFFFLLFLGCSGEYEGYEYPQGELYFPISLKKVPGTDFIFVVNTNFDLKYETGEVTVFDAKNSKLLKKDNEYLKTGNFGGFPGILMLSENNGVVYVPVRYDNTVHFAKFKVENGSVSFDCKEKTDNFCGNFIKGDENFEIGDDPFCAEIFKDKITGENVLAVTEMGGGDIDFFLLDQNGAPKKKLKYELGIQGMFFAKYDDSSGKIYITNKFYNIIYSVICDLSGEKPVEIYKKGIILPFSFDHNDYYRKAIIHDGILFVVDKNSSTIIEIDTKTDEILGFLPAAKGITGIDFLAPDKLVFVSFSEDIAGVVDIKNKKIIKTVKTPKNPYDIVVFDDGTHKKGFFTIFSDHKIGVINLDENSKNFGDIDEL